MQHVRREECPETYEAIERVISRLNEYADGKGEFTIVLEDLTGNSYISHVGATPFDDKKLVTTHQLRTKEQNEQIGFCAESSLEYPVSEGAIKKESPDIIKDLLDRKEKQPSDAEREAGPSKSSVFESIQSIDVDRIHTFPTHCFSCGAPGEERMINLSIPYFRDIVIMSFNCDHCGYRNNEVKSEGPISQFGRIIRLSVLRVEDLSRDLLKSSTAGLEIPEISLFVEPGSLGGRFTTVEGIIARIIESLDEQARMLGDSASEEDKKNWDDFFEKLRSLLKVEKPFTLILNDPIANSYIQSFTAPEPDPQIQEEDYVRSKEQDEMLGLDTMNTENYAEEDQKEEVC
ncbi:zinc finger protein ZPR1 homolog [Schistocerca gregaria]|uniref:zinc finger protein ZPR1 homolog n=1 Tax=Schistocerca gregaria TaxID=7010 RepID=UPI00211DB6B5|nr:zinc finger protein ZPR1 homolog [Schistocerca gregaria]